MPGAFPLVLASGGGQCLAVNGCHAYGPRIVGIIVGAVLVTTFLVIAVVFVRKLGLSRRQALGIVRVARPSAARKLSQLVDTLQPGQTTIVVSPGDAANATSRLSAGGTVEQIEKLVQLHRRGALTDEEFAQQKALLMSDGK